MSKIIAFANQKGGVSKTTTCHAVGYYLSKLGYKILCADLDSQSHLSVAFGVKVPEELPSTFTDLLEKFLAKRTVTKEDVLNSIVNVGTVDLLPCTKRMDELRNQLDSINAREYVVADILECIKNDYDYILLDCSGATNIFTTNALAFAQEVVIPCQCQYLSIGGIPLILDYIKSLKRRTNPDLVISGILLTLFQLGTNHSRECVEEVNADYKEMVFKTVIPLSIKVPEGQKIGKTVIEHNENNPVSVAYRKFTKELIKFEQ